MARTIARQADWDRALERTFRDAGLIDLADERAAMAAAREKRIGSRGCQYCGRLLRDPASVDLGVGPECRGKLRR